MVIKFKDFKVGKEGKIEIISIYKEDYCPFKEMEVFYDTKECESEAYSIEPWFLEINDENRFPEFMYDTSYIYSYTYYEDLDYYEVILCNDPINVMINELYNHEYIVKKLA